MALAATGSPDLAERISEASAREVRFAGINWVYSPVADVNIDPRNPVIGLLVPIYRHALLTNFC
jgi:beta-N-acetylhexosaminidase